jgi:hypothetical protein
MKLANVPVGQIGTEATQHNVLDPLESIEMVQMQQTNRVQDPVEND